MQTAWHRLEHAKSRISELDNHRNRLGADLARNSSSTAQKQGTNYCAKYVRNKVLFPFRPIVEMMKYYSFLGASGSQQGSGTLKQATPANYQSNSSTTSSTSTALKPELNDK